MVRCRLFGHNQFGIPSALSSAQWRPAELDHLKLFTMGFSFNSTKRNFFVVLLSKFH